jgi:hypothetical protein
MTPKTFEPYAPSLLKLRVKGWLATEQGNNIMLPETNMAAMRTIQMVTI